MRGCLVQVSPLDPATGTRVTYRCGQALNSRTLKADGQTWDTAITAAPRITFDFFDIDYKGTVQFGHAALTLNTKRFSGADRNYLTTLIWDGAPISIWSGDGLATADLTLEFTGLVTAGVIDRSTGLLPLSCEVNRKLIDVPLLNIEYGGGGGADGDPEVRGQLKPACFGNPINVPVFFFDQVNWIGQVDGYGNVTAINTLYENAASFGAKQADYATYAALLAAAIPEGKWGTCVAQGMIRLGAAPKGVITADPVAGAGTPGTMMQRWLTAHAGVTVGNIDAASFAALDAVLAALLGHTAAVSYFTQSQGNVLERCQAMLAACNATMFFAPSGQITASRAINPGAAAMTLNRIGGLAPQVMDWRSLDTPEPWWRLKAEAAKTWRVHSLNEIDYEDDIVLRGNYDPAETYRQGHVVYQPADGVRYLYINVAPSAGHAPPNAVYWDVYEDAADATVTTYADGTPLEALKPAQLGADITGTHTASAILSQGALATANSATWGTQVTGAGKPADNATVGGTFGTDLKETPGGITALLAAFKTAVGTAAAIASQGALATKSAAAWLTDMTGVPTDRLYATNLYDMSDWTTGFDTATAGFQFSNTPAVNSLVDFAGPNGHAETVWQAIADGSASSLGWTSARFTAGFDPARNYLAVAWVRRPSGAGGGTFYFGPTAGTGASWFDQTGAADANPYWLNSLAIPADDKWFLAVGILWGSGTSNADVAADAISGLYDPVTGKKVVSASKRFRHGAAIAFSGFRLFSTNTTPGITFYFARPRVVEFTNSPPSVMQFMTDATLAPADINGVNMFDGGSGSPSTPLLRSVILTALGTAAAIASQGAFATLSSAAYGSALLTGFGTLAPRSDVRFGTEVKRSDGTTIVTDSLAITSLGTASAIAAQGALATLSNVGPSLLTVHDGPNLIQDPEIADLSYWTFGTGAATSTEALATNLVTAAPPGMGVTTAIKSPVGDGTTASGLAAFAFPATAYWPTAEAGRRYRLTARIGVKAGFSGTVSVTFRVYAKDKSTILATGAPSTIADYRTVAAAADTILDAESIVLAPAGAAFITSRFDVNWSATLARAQYYLVGRPRLSMLTVTGSGGDLRLEDGVAGTDTLIRTLLGTSAAITGQGALATKSTATYGTADVTGFGALAARVKVALGDGFVFRADGTTGLTDALAVTSLGTASAIASQGAFATLNSAAYGSALLTGFGTLAPRSKVSLADGFMFRADGTTSLTEILAITSLGTASAIASQGALATKNQASAGDLAVTLGGANLIPDGSFELGSVAFTGASDGGGGTPVVVVGGGFHGSNFLRVDMQGTHSAHFTNSLFTAKSATLSVSVMLKDSGIVGTTGTGPVGPMALNITANPALGSVAGQFVSGSLAPTSGSGWTRFTATITGLTPGTSYYLGIRGASTSGKNKTDVDALMVTHGDVPMDFLADLAGMSHVYFGGGSLKETFGGVDATIANFKTASGTAAAIASQGSLATKSTVTYGTGDVTGFAALAARAKISLADGFIFRADTTTTLTEILTITSLGTASAIASQSAWATYSTITPTTMSNRTQNLDNTTGRISNYAGMQANRSYGLRSVFDTPALSDTYVGVQNITINIGASTLTSDTGGTISLPSGSLTGMAEGTKYFIYRTMTDPASATGSYGASTTLAGAIATTNIYLGFWTTRVGSGGAGGGGGYGGADCVVEDAFVAHTKGPRLASKIAAGDYLAVLDEDTMQGLTRAVVKQASFGVADCVRLLTESGKRLSLAVNTPITQPDRRVVIAGHALNGQVPVSDASGFRWERIVEVEAVGTRRVRNLDLGGLTFGAGDSPAAMLYTHNFIGKP